MNDTSWRNLSAILGLACVILIIAAGALLATSGESPAPSPLDTSAVGSATPSGTSSASSTAGSSAPSASSGSSATASAGPTATPQAPAPIASVTFSNLMLDASTDPLGKARTFTFITDGVGPVGIAITKSPAKETTKICASVDSSKPDCRIGTKVTYTGAYTDTAHSVWVVTLIGPAGAGPTVNVSFSWPTNNARITLTHGRLQGSSSPGVNVGLNGFTATFKTRSAGNVTLAASWTVITTDVDVSLSDVSGSSANLVDEKPYSGVQNLGTSGYSYAVTAAKSYQISFRDTSANSMRPDLTAVLSFP
ncbi:MAG: hypothetical protein ABSA21_08500 [Candidatus Limnocylindrales bacterium]